MTSSVFQCLLILQFFVYGTLCIKISQKLDFGTDDIAASARQPNIHSKSFGSGDPEHNKVQELSIACPSGNCDIIDKQSEAGAKVVVHVRTQTSNVKNISREAVPDVPIIIGTKSQDLPYYNNGPNVNVAQAPFPVSSLIGRPIQDASVRIRGGFDYTNYPFTYQDGNSNVNVYSIYNEPNSNDHRIPQHQFVWNNQKRLDGAGGLDTNYNPVEFKKVYPISGVGATTQQLHDSIYNQRPVSSENLGPCICPDYERRYYHAHLRH